ncbi:TPA: heme NO-binding domain-containing protein [Legionella bozemanae]
MIAAQSDARGTMKGIVFTSLNDMIIEQYGIETWDHIVTQMDLPSGGSYTVGGTYADTELSQLIYALVKIKNLEFSVFLESFGEYMFSILLNKYSIFLKKDMSLKEFLKSVDGTIHVEVKKLYPHEKLPSITYEETSPNQLIMLYRSPRKLCYFAIGLIKGAAKHFKKKITINHTLCMLQKNDHCRLEITFE